MPLDWAVTQNNLGNALWILGSGESSTAAESRRSPPTARRWRSGDPRARAARLGEDAEQPRHRAPGARRAGERHGALEEAVAAYRAALEERTRDRVPLDWAGTGPGRTSPSRSRPRRAHRSAPRAALAEIDAALEVFRAAGAEAYVAKAEGIRAAIAGADPG